MSAPLNRIIIVYGDSVFLRSVAAALRANVELAVVEIHPGAGLPSIHASLSPSLVIVDGCQTTAQELKTLMSIFPIPGLPFLSLNAENQQLTILSEKQYPAASLDDMARVLEQLSITLSIR